MTYDTGGRVLEPPEEQNDANFTSSTEQSDPNPETLISSFPEEKLSSLNIKISSSRWVVPVLPNQELECLLNAAIKLSQAGIDSECEPCMKFYRDGLTTSFMKILTDEAVSSWKYNIHHCILMSCSKLLHLIALHIKDDNSHLLNLLAVVFDPENKFHTQNASRQLELHLSLGESEEPLQDGDVFARSPLEPKNPRGWLVDLINRFGEYNGFDNFLERIQIGITLFRQRRDAEILINKVTSKASLDDNIRSNTSTTPNSKMARPNSMDSDESGKLSLPTLYALLRPFGQCAELLTSSTIEKYFMPIWPVVLEILENLSDDELKRDAKFEGKNDIITGIVKYARALINRVQNHENLQRTFEMCRLKIILRVLQISSFNGKMNALNEINKVLGYVSYYPHRQIAEDELDGLNAEKMAKWIRDNDVLGIVLRDSLHQPQYVEKLEKILRFLIKEKELTFDDLDAVWRAQAGKHEAIVKNVHDLLAKLAWDFNAEQLDHLFKCFQASMKSANKKQRERLLELNRRLAEDDKNGVMAQKVLKLFWTLAHSADIPPEVLDQALASHVKILDYSCSQERDAQKTMWLDKCVEELKAGDEWALSALRLIREICTLYETTSSHTPRVHQMLTRQQVIDRLQNEHTLVILVTTSLTKYMDKVRVQVKQNPTLNPMNLILDKRYPHPQQIQERLEFLKFLLKDGQLWLCAEQAKQIWQCLAVNAAFPSDREECFRWFGKLMGDEPDLDPGINKDFFENNLLKLDPTLLTESGIKCFERFFKAVNSKEERLKGKQRGYVLDNEDLIGKDYLWRVITDAEEDIAFKAIDLLKEVSTALGPRLQANLNDFHENFISECCDRLQNYYETVKVLTGVIEENSKLVDDDISSTRLHTAEKMCRVVKTLQEYIKECDRNYTGERTLLPLSRASRGKHINLYIRFQNPGRQLEDLEVITHNNETIFSFKRNLLKRIKATINNLKIDLYNCNGEPIEIIDDRHPLSNYNIRDKTLITVKLTPSGSGLASSPDSSSDSSSSSPPRPCLDMLRSESEDMLPGVIISQKPAYMDFLLKIYQLGSDLQHGLLRDSCVFLLHLLPLDRQTVANIHAMCNFNNSEKTTNSLVDNNSSTRTPEALFIDPSPARVLYNLEVIHAMLIPALDPGSEATLNLQSRWLHCGASHFILDLLTKNNFLPTADMHTKRAAFHCVLKIVKFFLYIAGCILSKVGNDPKNFHPDTDRSQVEIIKQVIQAIPGNSELTIRSMAVKLAQNIADEMLTPSAEGDRYRNLFQSTLHWSLPDMSTIKAIVNLAWAASGNNLEYIGSSVDFSQNITAPELADYAVCKEALEVLCIALVLHYSAYETLSRDNTWSIFIQSLVLTNPSRHIRQTAYEQLFLISTYCASDRRPFLFMVKLLIKLLRTVIPQHQETCADYFQLFCRILSYGCSYSWPLPICEELLIQEIDWLRAIRDSVKSTGGTGVHDDLLEGHLCLTKELMCYLSPEVKSLRSDLITEITDDYLFSASRQYLHLRRNGQILDINAAPPVCRNPHTISAACDLLVALCQNSVENMKILVKTLLDMFCTDIEPLREWEYLPPVGPRPSQGFCGLKNAGATCYMNSVLQQLFMVPSLRIGILSAQGAASDPTEDFSGELDSHECDDSVEKNYHVGILKHVQAIFAHLGHSSLQYYTPRGLWSHFKLQGEPVNLREQQDAVEFFMSLFESLDEGLKALGYSQLMGATLGGCFSDQKICQDCPHRYSKDEPFSAFSVDIRNHSSLTDSLEQYVKGEILEGADAYHCDKCDKKVVTVKRLCVRKLPPVLAIQLKRFEYDYERVCAIKFNDYFEFPRWLDMAPYTVSGLAKIEGEVIDIDDSRPDDSTETRYQLTGIVVHSGQASGGHYFSYILHKAPDGSEKWHKFDDGEVSECKMNEDEEMKAQCFGGDYMGEVYDNNLKRIQYRRQKRWWNAYMLFYTRCDHTPVIHTNCVEQLSLAESKHCILPMPAPIERSVRTQNIRFLHAKSLFSVEFFTFIKKLVNLPQLQRSEKIEKLPPATEDLSLLSMQLASQFLFHSGYRTKKTIRGVAIDWYETLCQHIRTTAVVRRWFAETVLLNPPTRLSEYILAAPSPEIRSVFGKLVVFFCHCAANDEPIQGYEGSNLCEQVLIAVLSLLKGDVADFGKHLPQYFNLFSLYAGLGLHEKQQLIRLNVPAVFMKVALDEGPGGQIKYQYPDLSKLHYVVSHLIRSCDVSSRCQSSTGVVAVKPNIYIDPHITYDTLMPLSLECSEYLFNRVSYVKRLIEDTNIGEEGVKLLQYCSWENPHFSRSLLAELLWHCGYAYWHEMRHHTELLLHILLIEDSWQNHRIHNAILGISDDREGLLDIIQRNKMNYQKRAYQCIKCMVQLFNRSRVALNMLHNTVQLGRQWAHAVEWLQDELDRHRGSGGQYNYNSWSPPAQSNDSTNSFVLERSQSAKNVLQMAFELCPEEDQEDQHENEVEDNNENDQVVTTTSTAINDTTKHACVQKQQLLLSTLQEGNQNSSPSSITNVSKLLSKVNIHADEGYDSTTKTSIQNVDFITQTWHRISRLDPSSSATSELDADAGQSGNREMADMDMYMTELFGGASSFDSSVSDGPSFRKQMQQLAAEPRQPYNYDVFKHWSSRKHTHRELHAVAMVVFALPATEVSVERAFSALALVLSDLRTGLSEDTLEHILLLKLNKDVFKKVMPKLYDWKHASPEENK
ncbi:probable ubiquitin carboxyl-terminal hydrolase FAF isoform X2 [Topomyia yanbarensis]|uniref:probable ubiquitin carboxyl-terminal hydrolase FAF isoform X2 n=1 Tax=Topomyia yanbarensis TaxID=2498891 RepID=UPI00273CED44|nr:probable ubiquitin carboxyl-terminal hydrolase FAF isoform X2 [Topomyia yanbarensis]